MIHSAVWWGLKHTLRYVFDVTTVPTGANGHALILDNTWLATLVVILGVALIILLSHLSYKLVEMPVNELRHRLVKV